MMLDPDVANWIGFAGTFCIIAAYAYLTFVDRPNPFVLHGTNLTGAALLTVSLLVHTNLASLVLEGFWAAIAIYGLVKAVRLRGAKVAGTEP
ncbi:hypothetical protein J4558_26515 [Leptolyngbya sp. 15MV]|nr:hypothetical protein J4558_26515 [Leptolyngbya sp. 15MV]